jgi:hypothetical protein
MHSSRKLTQAVMALCALVMMGTAALAADPGLTYPTASEVSDQKAGSVLYYTVYSSSSSLPNRQNTRFNITNTSSTSASFVHLFFVDGGTCGIADRYICLTANQTMTFLASEQDPGTTGYLVAVAVDGVFGCPVSFNHLIGDEYIKLETGHQANLGAEAFAALYDDSFGGRVLPGCDGNSTTATINFNGLDYNRAPRVLAVSNIPSILDSNDTRLAVIRVGGNLLSGAATIGSIFGLLFDDQEEPHSWNSSGGCQFVRRLDNTFPRTTPRYDVVIPAGATGWLKFYSTGDVPLLGAVINFNPNAGTSSGAFNGGHNLHKLTLSATGSIVIPVFPPAC